MLTCTTGYCNLIVRANSSAASIVAYDPFVCRSILSRKRPFSGRFRCDGISSLTDVCSVTSGADSLPERFSLMTRDAMTCFLVFDVAVVDLRTARNCKNVECGPEFIVTGLSCPVACTADTMPSLLVPYDLASRNETSRRRVSSHNAKRTQRRLCHNVRRLMSRNGGCSRNTFGSR